MKCEIKLPTAGTDPYYVNIVYNELLIRRYYADIGIIDVYGKAQEGKRVRKQLEVDFVVNQGSQRYYIRRL